MSRLPLSVLFVLLCFAMCISSLGWGWGWGVVIFGLLFFLGLILITAWNIWCALTPDWGQ